MALAAVCARRVELGVSAESESYEIVGVVWTVVDPVSDATTHL